MLPPPQYGTGDWNTGVTCVYRYGCNHSLLPVQGTSTAEKEIGLEAIRPPSGSLRGFQEKELPRLSPRSLLCR